MKRSEINKLDEIWATLVKDRADWKCEFCGIRGVRMEAAHVAGRRYRSTRWGYYNTSNECIGAITIKTYDLCGHCFCHNCHQQYDEHGPLEQAIVERTVGIDRKIRIQAKAQELVSQKQDYNDIKQLLENL